MTTKINNEPANALDFDHWANTARTNPHLFEEMRRQAIEEVIAQAPKEQQQRLRCLQWRIDQERRQAKSPLGACIRISRMMWESVSGSNGLLEQLHRLSNHRTPISANARQRAKVLAFASHRQ